MAQMAALSVEAKSMAVKKFRAALHIAVFSFYQAGLLASKDLTSSTVNPENNAISS